MKHPTHARIKNEEIAREYGTTTDKWHRVENITYHNNPPGTDNYIVALEVGAWFDTKHLEFKYDS